MALTIIWLVTLLLFAAGIFGTFIPALPGIGLIFAGILWHAWTTGFTTLSGTTVLVFGVFALLTWLANFAASSMGARLGGGSYRAMMGTTVGAIVGIFWGPVGIMCGAFIGALLGALSEGQSTQKASKVALWSVVAVLGASLMQAVLGIALILAFFIAIIW